MAGSLATINIRFQVMASELRTQLQNVSLDFEKVGKKLQDAGKDMSKYITAPLLGLGVASLKTYGDLEALDKGLISVMGSSEAAAAEFEKLREVAKLPGLGLEEAVRGSVSLQSAGFSADEARASLLAFGNALATVGKGKRELDLVTLALTQLNNKFSGFGQDLRQLTEQLPQLRGALLSAFGTSDSEAIAKLGVSGKQVVQLLTKEFAKLPKVAGGFNNALENTADNLKIRFAQLGESIYKSFNIEGVLNAFDNAIGKIVDNFKALEPSVQKAILVVTGLTAAAGPLLFSIGGLLKAVPLIVSGFATISAAALPVIAGAAALFLAYQALTAKTKELTAAQYRQRDEQDLINGLTDEATRLISAQRLRLDQLAITARNTNETLENRKKAIAEINKISPEYLGNITLETIRTDAATQAINRYNESLFKGALARAALTKIDQNAQKRLEAQLTYEKQTYQYNLKKNEAISKGAAEAQKFFREEGGAQERAYLRYQDRLDQLDAEDEKLAKIYGSNESYLALLKDVGVAASNVDFDKGPKAGTIKYYEEQIKKLRELQEEFETTPEAIAVLEGRIESLQKKIDTLRGTRVKVKSIFEGVDVPKLQSQGTIDKYDKDIAKLKELQSQVATTSETFYDLEYAIQSLELEKEIKFDLPTGELNNFSTEFQNFGGKYKDTADKIRENTEKLSTDLAPVLEGIAESFASGFAEAIASIADGGNAMQGIFGLLLNTIADITIQIGKAAIGIGIAMQSIQYAFSSPAAAIAAGVALIAIGSLIKANIPKFEDGGIVGGSSFYGDKILARVNSGEMILNRDQQRRIYDMINPAASSADLGAIEVYGSSRIEGDDILISFKRTQTKQSRTK